MARGRPALATVMMAVGIISLAVPLSTTFAGEFLILAGVFQQGWVWAVIGAVAMVLAAMYMLRAISAVLHQDVGPAVSESALDLRVGELAIVVPLVLCLIGLSRVAEPRSRATRLARRAPSTGSHAVRAMIVEAARRLVRPLAVARADSPRRALLLMVAVFVPRRARKADVRVRRVRRLRRRVRVAAFLDDRAPHGDGARRTTRCGATAGARSRR